MLTDIFITTDEMIHTNDFNESPLNENKYDAVDIKGIDTVKIDSLQEILLNSSSTNAVTDFFS